MRQIRWGIMGTGNIARQFAEGAGKSARSVLGAVGSRDGAKASQFAATYHIARAHGSYDALIADPEVDAIYLSLPNSMHHEWTLKSLNAGKHVLCEKPLATSVRQAVDMFECARLNKRHLVEAFMYRAHPQTHKLVDLVRAGSIGKLKLIRTSFCFRVRNTQGNIRFDASLAGGALMDVGCYCVSLSRLLAGADPVKVAAVAKLHESGVDEQTSVVMKYPNDITAEFTCGMSVQADNTAHLCGDEGFLTVGWPWKPAPPSTSIILSGGVPPRQDNPAIKPVAPAPREIAVPNDLPLYGIEADAFAAAVLDDAEPFVTPEESIGNMRTIEAIRSQIGL
jgi:D-xylose 1-dehydrogenase (NADP+, D-xylono-1,5-lactone-forming)